MSSSSLSFLIWSTFDLLRGDYNQSDYGKVILPFTPFRMCTKGLANVVYKMLKEGFNKEYVVNNTYSLGMVEDEDIIYHSS